MYNFGPINQITNNKLNKNKVDKDNYNSKVSELENKNKVQDSRIDNLITVNNPTEGNSELQDIRVGHDGTKYTSAGEAVREQFNIVSKDLKNTLSIDLNFIFNGYINRYGC